MSLSINMAGDWDAKSFWTSFLFTLKHRHSDISRPIVYMCTNVPVSSSKHLTLSVCWHGSLEK